MSGDVRTGGKLRVAAATATAAALTVTVLAVTADAGPSGDSPAAGPGAGDPRPAAAGGTLFDDFDYTGHADPALSEHGWRVRSGGGGPGVPGVVWKPENVTFADEGGESLMTLRTTSAGSGATTEQTEISTRSMKYENGTYAARVRFADQPVSGPDGDHLVQTFFTINELKAPMDPDYAEYDFEYLPNGGWGESGSTLFATSWETYNPDPWEVVNEHTAERASFAGWHDLVLTIDGNNITYYLDGREFARHGADYLPEKPMAIDFNQWLIDLEGHSGTEPRAYEQQVDYVLHIKDEILTPQQAQATVDAYRSAGTAFEDTVPPAGG